MDELKEINDDTKANAEINIMKQLSESFAKDALKSELSLTTGDSVDRHMDMDAVTETMNHLESKKSVELTKATS